MIGDFSGYCRVPNEIDGYYAVFSTWHQNEHQVFQVAAFKVNRYHPTFESLMAYGVEKNEKLVIQEESIFWKTDDIYYAIQGDSSIIDAFVDAKIYQ